MTQPEYFMLPWGSTIQECDEVYVESQNEWHKSTNVGKKARAPKIYRRPAKDYLENETPQQAAWRRLRSTQQ